MGRLRGSQHHPNDLGRVKSGGVYLNGVSADRQVRERKFALTIRSPSFASSPCPLRTATVAPGGAPLGSNTVPVMDELDAHQSAARSKSRDDCGQSKRGKQRKAGKTRQLHSGSLSDLFGGPYPLVFMNGRTLNALLDASI